MKHFTLGLIIFIVGWCLTQNTLQLFSFLRLVRIKLKWINSTRGNKDFWKYISRQILREIESNVFFPKILFLDVLKPAKKGFVQRRPMVCWKFWFRHLGFNLAEDWGPQHFEDAWRRADSKSNVQNQSLFLPFPCNM